MTVQEIYRLGVNSRIVVAISIDGHHPDQDAWEVFREHADSNGHTIPPDAVIYRERWTFRESDGRIRRAKGEDGRPVTGIDLRKWRR